MRLEYYWSLVVSIKDTDQYVLPYQSGSTSHGKSYNLIESGNVHNTNHGDVV